MCGAGLSRAGVRLVVPTFSVLYTRADVSDRFANGRRAEWDDLKPRCAVRLLANSPAGGRNNSLDRRKVPGFKRSRGIRHVVRAHAINRRVKVVERLFRQRRDDLGAKAGAQWRFMP